jgi:hypothetical protein
VRPAIVAILILACCRTAVGQSPLAIKWKTETPLSISSTDPIDAKVAIDPDGNILRVVHTGYTPQTTVSKFTLSGQKIFEKTWSTPQPNNNPFFLQTFSVDHAGNSILLILQNSSSPAEGVVHYVSYDGNGTLRWDKTERIPYEGNVPWFRAAAVDNQNNIIFGGTISNRLTAQKISPAGELLWRQSIERPGLLYSWAYDFDMDAAGRAYVVGAGNTTAGESPLLVSFEDTAVGEIATGTTRTELRNIRATENGALYVVDGFSIIRINSSGQTEWSRSAESQYAPLTLALMAEEKIALITFEGFNILDKTGKSLGSGRLSGIRNARGQGESLFLSRGARVSQLRSEASLVSEFDFGENTEVYDLALTANSDAAFVGIKSTTNGGRFLLTSALIHSLLPDAPRIVQQPQGGIVIAGNDFTASVGASGSNLNYQWFFEPSPSSRSALDGQTNRNLQLTNLQVYQSGNYSVEVSNMLGKVSSAYAKLAVHLMPTIINNPTTIPSRPYLGDRVVWTYRASYTSPAGSQWFKDGNRIPGATNLSYLIPICGPSHLGKYSVLITNLVGEAKSDEVEFPKFLENVDVTVITNDLVFAQPILAKDAQTNVYLSGAVYSGGVNTGVITAKFDESGQLIWTNRIPKLLGIQPTFISALAKDGAMYIPGTTNSIPVVCKLDSSGAVAWMANIKTNLSIIARIQAGELHSYVAGLRTLPTKAFVLVALNSDGTRAWTNSISVPSTVTDSTCWLEVTADEQIYLASRALKTLYAINSSGNILWTNSYSTNFIVDLKAGPENSVYVVGQNEGKPACSKYNAAGEKLWTTVLRRPGLLNVQTTDLQVDALGNAYIISDTASAVEKIDSDGNVLSQWSPVAEYPSRRQLQTSESGVAYMLRSPFDSTTVAKYDANGVRRWNRNLPGSFIDVAFIPVTDRKLFVFSRGRLIKVQDLETADMAQITANIQRGIAATNPVLRVEVKGAAAQKLNWYLNGLPGGGAGGIGNPIGSGESIVPWFYSAGSYYSVEVETQDSVIAPPDHFFDVFSIINEARAVDGNLRLSLRGVADSTFRLQRSRNLIDWQDYNTTTSDANGITEIAFPISNQEQTEYFRAVK